MPQSNQIQQAVGDGNFETSRLAQLADTLNNFRYKLQLKLTDALTNQICSSKQKLDKNKNHLSFCQFFIMNPIMINIKKCDKNMEEGSDNQGVIKVILICDRKF